MVGREGSQALLTIPMMTAEAIDSMRVLCFTEEERLNSIYRV